MIWNVLEKVNEYQSVSCVNSDILWFFTLLIYCRSLFVDTFLSDLLHFNSLPFSCFRDVHFSKSASSVSLISNLIHGIICLIYFSTAAPPRILSYCFLHTFFLPSPSMLMQCYQSCHAIFCLINNLFFFPPIHVFWCFPLFYHAISSLSGSFQFQDSQVWKKINSL